MKKTILFFLLLAGIWSCTEDDINDLDLGTGDGVLAPLAPNSQFATRGGYLYVTSAKQFMVMKVSSNAKPELIKTYGRYENFVSIRIFGNNLYLASDNNVYIYNLSNPENPIYLTSYPWKLSCGPLIANEDYVYALRSGDMDCSNSETDQLMTLDLKDMKRILIVDRLNLDDTRDLTIFENELYVSQGVLGTLKFDISVPDAPRLDTLYDQIPSFRLVGLSDIMIVKVGSEVSQYSMENGSLKLLSKIQ